MKADDLEHYLEYLRRMENVEGIRIILQYPDDYIELLKENSVLKQRMSDYLSLQQRYGAELFRAIEAEDKLRELHEYLDSQHIFIPNFKW